MSSDVAVFSQELTELEQFQLRQTAFAARFNLSYDEYKRIMCVSTTDEAVVILELMKVKKHRASYRSKMHQQVREWLDSNSQSKPLTSVQYVYLAPTWPITWHFPTYNGSRDVS
jgi:hypothetical protein